MIQTTLLVLHSSSSSKPTKITPIFKQKTPDNNVNIVSIAYTLNSTHLPQNSRDNRENNHTECIPKSQNNPPSPVLIRNGRNTTKSTHVVGENEGSKVGNCLQAIIQVDVLFLCAMYTTKRNLNESGMCLVSIRSFMYREGDRWLL